MEILVFLAGFLVGALCVFIPFKVINKNNKASQDILLEQMKLYFENTANKIFKESSSELSNQNRERLDEFFKRFKEKIEDFEKFVEIDVKTRKIINYFMPGPITLILKTKTDVPHFVDLGTGFVGVRIPDDKFVVNMIKEVGEPLLVPSANISSFPPAKNDKRAIEYFHDTIDGVVEGECINGTPSSIFKIDNGKIILIRKGLISLEEVEEIVKWKFL